MKSSKTDKFEELQAKWYAKLKDKGFTDIEQKDGNLKEWSYRFTNHKNQPRLQAQEEYYRRAGQFTYEHKFSSPMDKLIWKLHAEGVFIKDIVIVMKTKGYKVYKRLVHETIQATAELMKKHYYG